MRALHPPCYTRGPVKDREESPLGEPPQFILTIHQREVDPPILKPLGNDMLGAVSGLTWAVLELGRIERVAPFDDGVPSNLRRVAMVGQVDRVSPVKAVHEGVFFERIEAGLPHSGVRVATAVA